MTTRFARRTLRTRLCQFETLELRATPATFFPLPTTLDGDASSLRAEVAQSNANNEDDTIVLASGIYALSQNGTGEDIGQTGDLDITAVGQTLTIRGAGATATWIRSDVIDRVLHVHTGARLVLQDLTITHGRAGNDIGGGILNHGDLELHGVEIIDNFARHGGGVYNAGTAVIFNNTIYKNFAVEGGGIYNLGDLNVINSTISTNTAGLTSSAPTLEMNHVVSGFDQAVAIENAGDQSGRMFVVEQEGIISIIQGNTRLSTPFLDIQARVRCCNERGLLGLAFHPDYGNPGSAGEGKFYVHYSANSSTANHKSVISEFQVSAGDPDLANSASERVLLEFDQPFSNHNGGDLKFGPDDGYLYISSGDGGSGGDPQDNAQNRGNLLGAILRIDVNASDGPGGEYGIPPDNPFVGQPGVREEIFAFGLRNPFRTSFDDGPLGPLSEDRLFVGDVGQSAREEIDLVTSGGNYGWRCREGTVAFNSCDPTPPFPGAFIDPIADYPHQNRPGGLGVSAIGGYVYRGSEFPSLTETYIFADFNGRIFSLHEVPSGNGWNLQLPNVVGADPFVPFARAVRGFGEDEAGELYFTNGSSVFQVTAIESEFQAGGGILAGGTVHLESVTVASNRASNSGGGIGRGPGLPQVTIRNTIIADNEAPSNPDFAGPINSDGFNLVEDLGGLSIGGNQNGLLTGLDPNLGPLADNGGGTSTHALREPSAAIDAADPGNASPVDQIGTPRAVADLGAYELVTSTATVELGASRDNTLYEDDFGSLSNGSGQYLFAGAVAPTLEGLLRRGLISFDVASVVPVGATIVDATLTLNMSRTIAGAHDVALHRTLADWGEGASNAGGQEGGGDGAQPGDATWIHTFSSNAFWSTPGGDFQSGSSATTSVAGTGQYQWSSAGMVADIQGWLDDPSTNFGWTLRGNEAALTTAKRFDSREHPIAANRPSLSITYTTAAATGVTDRHIFYNNSAGFDVDPGNPYGNDNGAIAIDKQALLPAETARFANYTSYDRGINGVMIDVGRLAQTIKVDVDDFQFRVGNNNDPSSWATAPDPISIRIEPAANTSESDRIIITWPDRAIQNQWLEVTLLATDASGLASDDVFYFGNAIGETGNAPDTVVNGSDFAGVRGNPKGFADPAAIDDRFDINRDRQVNATDMLIVRDYSSSLGGLLNLITPTATGSLVGKHDIEAFFDPVESMKDGNTESASQKSTLSQSAELSAIDFESDRSLALHYAIAQHRLDDDSRDEPLAAGRLDELFAQLDELLSQQ